jgi:hypothetical protein
MRTTVTLDADVDQQARQLTAKLGKPFKQVINEALRAGLRQMRRPSPKSHSHKPHDMGRPSMSLDKIQEVLARIDGEQAR